jgi:hypothetical protein
MTKAEKALIAQIPHMKTCKYKGEEGYILTALQDWPKVKAVRAFCPECKVCCAASVKFLTSII